MDFKADTESSLDKNKYFTVPIFLPDKLIDCYHDNLFIEDENQKKENHKICTIHEKTGSRELKSIYKALCIDWMVNKYYKDKDDSKVFPICTFFADSIVAPEKLDECHLNLLEAKRIIRERENIIDTLPGIGDKEDDILIANGEAKRSKSSLKENINDIRGHIDDAVKFYRQDEFTSNFNAFKEKVYHTKYDNTMQGFVNRYMKPIEALLKLPESHENLFCRPLAFGITELRCLAMVRMLPERHLRECKEKFNPFLKNISNGEKWEGVDELLGMLRIKMMNDKLDLFEKLGSDKIKFLTTSDARSLENDLSKEIKQHSVNSTTSSWQQTLNILSDSDESNLFETTTIIARTSPTYQLMPFASKMKKRSSLIVMNIVLTRNNRYVKTLPKHIEKSFIEKALEKDATISGERNIKMLVSFLSILMHRKKELVLPEAVQKIVKLQSKSVRYEKKKFWVTIYMPGYRMGSNMVMFLINCLYLILFMQNFNWCVDLDLNGEMLHCVSENLLEPEEIEKIKGKLILVPGNKRINPASCTPEKLEEFLDKLMDYKLNRKIRLY